MQRLAGIAKNTLPYAIVVSVAVAALVPRPASPGTTLAAGLVFGGLLAVSAGLGARRAVSRAEAYLAIAGAVCALWYLAASLTALNPAVSFMGIIAQHNGSATWILGFVWLLATLLLAEKRTLRRILAAIGATGFVLAVIGEIEVLNEGWRISGDHARALFENSVSFGQFLAVAIVCAAAWVLSSRARLAYRLVMWAGIAFMGWMLVEAASRTGFLALGVAAAIAALIWRFPSCSARGDVVRTGVLTAAPVTLNALMIGSGIGLLGAGPAALVARFGTGRDLIWRAAWTQMMKSPVAGFGMEQFSVWTSWTISPEAFESKATTDPHSLVFSLGLGGGFVGLILAIVVLALLVLVTLRAAHATKALAVALPASLPLALVAAGTVGWIAPATMLTGCAAIGAVAAAASSLVTREGASWAMRTVRGIAVAAGLIALVMGVIGVANVPLEVRHDGQTDPAVLAQLYARWPDPAYSTTTIQALTPALVAGDPQAAALAEEIMERSLPDAAWRVELAAAQLVAAQALEARDPTRFSQFERIVASGVQADPTSGFWYTFAAIEADRLDLAAQAEEYAAKALDFDLPPESRAEMERLAR